MFLLCLKLDAQRQGSGRILDVDGQGVWGGDENWTISMDVICVSSLRRINRVYQIPRQKICYKDFVVSASDLNFFALIY